jgi:diguanylate cyclase (GGDEF)-like protein
VLPDHYNNKTELIFPGPDTQSIVPEVHRSDITWAGEEAHLIIIRDLTRPKRNAAQLAESELIPHSHFENAPVALWEEDFSEVKKLIDILSVSGISDFRTYFVTHPDEARECANLVKIIDVNQFALDLFEVSNKDDFLNSPKMITDSLTEDVFLEQLIAIAEGNTQFECESVLQAFSGKVLDVFVRLSIPPDGEKNWSKVFFTTIDITEHKRVETLLRESEARHRSLFVDSPISLWEEDFSAIKEHVDELKRSGVTDFRKYFLDHPEILSRYTSLVKIVNVNQVTLDLFGVKDRDELSDSIDLVNVIDTFRDELTAFAEGKNIFEGEIEIQTPSVGTKHALVRLSIAPGYEHTWSKVFFSIIEITDLKNTEAALQKANKELIHYVNTLQQRNREISMLNEMGDLLQSCRTIEDAYSVFSYSIEQLFPDLSGTLAMFTEAKDLLEVVSTWGELELPNIEQDIEPEKCWALRRGQVHIVDSSRSRLRCQHLTELDESGVIRSYACTPLVAHGEILGLFTLIGEKDQVVETREQLVITVAERAALAISNLKLREVLHRQSIVDPLTGLYNRRFMVTMLTRDLLRAARQDHPLSIVMLDIDNFKSYNRDFGHDAGDDLLITISHFIESHTRSEDLACRYVEDGFTIILPDTPLDIATNRAEQLREGLKESLVQHHGAPSTGSTVSMGIACYPAHGDSTNEILGAASEALTQAKELGRDRVVVAGKG